MGLGWESRERWNVKGLMLLRNGLKVLIASLGRHDWRRDEWSGSICRWRYARVVDVEEGASYATGGPVRKERIPRNANRQNVLKWKHVDIPFQASNQSIMLVKQDIQ